MNRRIILVFAAAAGVLALGFLLWRPSALNPTSEEEVSREEATGARDDVATGVQGDRRLVGESSIPSSRLTLNTSGPAKDKPTVEGELWLHTLDSQGQYVQGVRASILETDGVQALECSETGRPGILRLRFRLSGDARDVTIVASHPAYRNHTTVLTPEHAISDGFLRIRLIGAIHANGVVLNGTNGVPVEGASVRAMAINGMSRVSEVSTDSKGRFELDSPSTGRYLVLARKVGIGTASAWLEFDERDAARNYVLSLAGASRLEGVVTDDHGRPKAEVRVQGIRSDRLVLQSPSEKLGHVALRAEDEERDDGLYVFSTVTNEEGKFSIGGVSSGTYMFFETGNEAANSALGPYSGLDIALDYGPTYSLLVRVFGKYGDRLNNYSLKLRRRDEKGEFVPQAVARGDTPGENGFLWTTRTPGEVLIQVSSGGSVAEERLTIGAAAEQMCDVFLR